MSLNNETTTTANNINEHKIKSEKPDLEDAISNQSINSTNSNISNEQLVCHTCQKDYDDLSEYYQHLLTHVQHPKLVLQRCDDPEIQKKSVCGPLRFSIKTTNNKFKIVRSPENIENIKQESEEERPPIPKLRILLPEQLSDSLKITPISNSNNNVTKVEDNNITELDDKNKPENNKPIPNGDFTTSKKPDMVELHSLPSESQSPSFPGQSPAQPDHINTDDASTFWPNEPSAEDPLQLGTESGEKEAETHNSLLQNFLNDNVETIPKDTGISSNETEYISLERLAEKNVGCECPVCGERCLDKQSLEVHQKAMNHFLPVINATSNSSSSSSNSLVPFGQSSMNNLSTSSPLDGLSNLPMQQLAQQVNRLQQGPVHQQNVLINIQQFGHPQYGRPDMGSHYGQQHYPTPQQHSPHMYGGYHHPPPHPDYQHPMYYPSASGMYPPPPPMQMAPQMQSQMASQMTSQMSPQMSPQMSSQMHPNNRNSLDYSARLARYAQANQSAQHSYGPSEPSRTMMPPQGPAPQQQSRMAPPPPPLQQHVRPRARMPIHHQQQQHQQQHQQQQRPGGRMLGPRAASINSGQIMRPNMPQQIRPIRRPIHTTNDVQGVKRKRLDILIPDTNDNDDCHVISMQKCNDGIPIIKNVQGANTNGNNGENSIDPVVHLTDSITLSVRNPKDSTPIVQQKKNDAKAVANILATRGITVTPAAKTQKELTEQPVKKVSQAASSPPVAINLNNAVSIIPTARGNATNVQSQSKETNTPARPPRPPTTVDLTEDEPVQISHKQSQQQQQHTTGKRNLPHQCDLCSAQYPTLHSLMNHRRTYHKTGAPSELGVPVVDLKQPAVLNKLSAIGIHNYIPLPQLGNGSGNFAVPIVSVNAARNPNICNLGALGSGAVLPLGPLRHISNLPNNKQ